MKSSKDEFVEVFENCIQSLIKKQAELVVEIHSLELALETHRKDSIKYNLIYNYDEETCVYSYSKGAEKRIGF